MELRDISTIKLAASISAHHQLAITEVQELPLATEQNRRYQIPLRCPRTGMIVATIATITVAGHVPLLGQWKDTQVLHPLFSLTPVALLQFARNSWLRFCALSPEETVDSTVVAKQEEQLRIATLVMLHNLTDVRQDICWMPDWKDVMANWTGLMTICYWRAYLDSDRFKFPSIRISKMEKDVDIRSYLQVCFQRKKDYENNVNSMIADEKERIKLAAAEKAVLAIRGEVAGKRPLSPKILWRWFAANMPNRYRKDIAVPNGWMWELFTATEKSIFDFTSRDIELFEEIFLVECPTGSSISHAFLEVLRGKHSLLTNHFETYEILIPEQIAADVKSGAINVAEEPRIGDFPSKVSWKIAHARWSLAQPSARQHQEAVARHQRTETVAASFRPHFVIGAEADQLPETEDDDNGFDAIAINADMENGDD